MALLITFADNEISDYLRVDPGQEVGTITSLKESAMAEAETFLNTDFSTSSIDGTGLEVITPVESPAVVKLWVLERIAEKFENRGKKVKADFSDLKPYRVINFSAPRNLNRTHEVTTERDIVNGVT